MRVGSLVYATTQGLGYLAKAFVDNGVVTHPFIVSHGSRQTQPWYVGAPVGVPSLLNFKKTVLKFAQSMDVMVFFETPFWWELIDECRKVGVKTVLMPMYECMPYPLPAKPDTIWNPSALDQKHYPDGERVTVPVYASTWKERYRRVKVFVHNAGHHGLKGRNGTTELCQAWWMVNSSAKLILRTQEGLSREEKLAIQDLPNVDVRVGTFPHESLYDEGDVFIYPEKFNGLSLPLQEAFAAGMMVMTTNRFPNTEWLPDRPLINVSSYRTQQVHRRFQSFDEAVINPKDIADRVNSMMHADLMTYNLAGKRWADANDWSVWKPKYQALLEQVRRS